MINKISYIKKLGVFSNFDWDSEVRDDKGAVVGFKKCNVLYGRNYSGKTSLSRVFKSLEDRKISERITNAEFSIVIDNNSQITNADVDRCPLDVRVFSSDFISTHLQWLNDENNGEIRPFAIMGDRNVEIERRIKDLNDKLGSVEEKKGMMFQRYNTQESSEKATRQKNDYERKLNEKLRSKAREIKENQIFKDVNYDITKINQDIEGIKRSPRDPLSEDDISIYTKYLKEELKPEIEVIRIELQDINELAISANLLLNKKVSPSKTIQSLINDALLQEWVRNGIDLHRSKLDKCAFCGGVINDELWEKLDSHFSQESESLRQELTQLLSVIESDIEACNTDIPISATDFYATYSSEANQVFGSFIKHKKEHLDMLSKIKNSVEMKLTNIFAYTDPLNTSELTSSLRSTIDSINDLITKNNAEGSTLSSTQMIKRVTLRHDVVLKFINDIHYDQSIKDLNKLRIDEKDLHAQLQKIDDNITNINQELRRLASELQDERKGAHKVNEYLSSYFGHDSLSLDAVKCDDSGEYKFIIKRGESIAYNLSEGEKSLISFCYFMAKLDDLDTTGKKIIVWIDDPVSSLDCNHIFFVFSLIENLIAKPMKDLKENSKFSQLFISTHNLDFLKYLKTLSVTSKQHAHFIINRIHDTSSINVMPSYLRNYVTEFNYLFNQIYLCAAKTGPCDNPENYYNFGNNARKFLEAYLFYKYPCKEEEGFGLKERILKFFDDDLLSQVVTFRVGNELSHLEESFDRSVKPIDIAELQKVAYLILSKIKEKDIDQYSALIRSINGTDIVTPTEV